MRAREQRRWRPTTRRRRFVSPCATPASAFRPIGSSTCSRNSRRPIPRRRAAIGGTGLGLAISRQLVEIDGRHVVAHEHRGRRVDLRVHRAVAHRSGPGRRHACRWPNCTASASSSSTTSRSIASVMTRAGVELGHAARWPWRARRDARQALLDAQHSGDPFRLVLVDYLMPDEDGESLARAITTGTAFGAVGLVMVTSAAQSGDAERFTRAGFSAYFIKPVRSTTADGRRWRRCSGRSKNGSLPAQIITRHTLDEGQATAASGRANTASRQVRPASRCAAPWSPRTTPSTRSSREKLLQRAGWQVDIVADGAAAVARASAETVRRHPDGLRDAGHGRLRGDRCHPAAPKADHGTRRSSP